MALAFPACSSGVREAQFQGLLSASGSALGPASQCPWSTVKSCSASWRGFLPFGEPSAFREHVPRLANTPLTEKVRHKQMNVRPTFLLDLLSTELNVANIYRVPAVCPGSIKGTKPVGGLPQSAERVRTEVRGGGPPEGRSGGLGGLACSALCVSRGWGVNQAKNEEKSFAVRRGRGVEAKAGGRLPFQTARPSSCSVRVRVRVTHGGPAGLGRDRGVL